MDREQKIKVIASMLKPLMHRAITSLTEEARKIMDRIEPEIKVGTYGKFFVETVPGDGSWVYGQLTNIYNGRDDCYECSYCLCFKDFVPIPNLKECIEIAEEKEEID